MDKHQFEALLLEQEREQAMEKTFPVKQDNPEVALKVVHSGDQPRIFSEDHPEDGINAEKWARLNK
jgi:hypothetical protein